MNRTKDSFAHRPTPPSAESLEIARLRALLQDVIESGDALIELCEQFKHLRFTTELRCFKAAIAKGGAR